MKECYGIVTEEHCRHRDEMVKNDKRQFLPRSHPNYRSLEQLFFQWDGEWVEKDQASKHDYLKLTEGKTRFIYDIDNLKDDSRDDYKYKNKNGVNISQPTQKRIDDKEVDRIVPWEYSTNRWKYDNETKTVKYHKLEANEKVYYRVYDPIDAKYVRNNLNEKNLFTEELN
jgi:hypothetical protein